MIRANILRSVLLARAVAADDAHDLAFIHFEVDVLQRPEGIRALPQFPERLYGRFQNVHRALAEGLIRPVQPDPVPLREVLHLDDGLFGRCHEANE